MKGRFNRFFMAVAAEREEEVPGMISRKEKESSVKHIASVILALAVLAGTNAFAQSGRMAVSFVSVCTDGTVPGTSGSCPTPTTDTHQIVVGPDGVTSINLVGDLAQLADEHSTILPPNYLPNHGTDYLFFVAAGGGMSVLKSAGPNTNGQWQLNMATDFGHYTGFRGFHPVFSSAMDRTLCPTVSDRRLQDPTYDLNYAQPGTVIKDPTNPINTGPGSLIMIYEGTNRCIGLTGGSNTKVNNSFYSTIAVATSNDFGQSWPAYRYLLDASGNLQFPLPLRNPCTTLKCKNESTFCTALTPCIGPNPNPNANTSGAFGDRICILNDCHTAAPSPFYGRYPVFSPPACDPSTFQNDPGKCTSLSIEQAVQRGLSLNSVIGAQTPSAFLDDAKGDAFPYVYATAGGLMITRAQLNGGTSTLSFNNWSQGSFSQPGVGGLADSISFLGPQGLPQNCQGQGQHATMSQISYVEQAQQYLLTFVCMSSTGDPATQAGGAGAAWFYSTNSNLDHQDQWSTPQEIPGSWVPYSSTACPDYDGWYPTFMSLNTLPGHLATTGFTFYMHGCTDSGAEGARQYSTRAFTINLKSTRTFQGIDAQHVFVLGSDGRLWLEQGPFSAVPPARQMVDSSVDTFQAVADGTHNVFVLDVEGNLWLESPPFGTGPSIRQEVDSQVCSFQALNSQKILVLGNDGELWIEQAPFGTLPPARQAVDANVRDFHALDATRILVLGTDGNLWLEQAPFGFVPPVRVQVDGNVLAFQNAPGSNEIYVLGTDGNLWLEQPPFGQVPPARVQVDGNVRSFQAIDNSRAFVLDTSGNLWLEFGPFGTVPPTRQEVDAKTRAFQALDLSHIYVLDANQNLWLEQAPFGSVPPVRVQVDGNVK